MEGKRTDKIREVLQRSVAAVYPDVKSFEELLRSGRKLKIYTGIDPTGRLHIGHLVVLRKLKQLQDLGHKIIVLIGDFTARIGDPTDKAAARKKLTPEEVEKNAEGYLGLISKVLDTSAKSFILERNSKWSDRLKIADFIELASHFTLQQLVERDMFQERLKGGKEIYLHEFLYPVFQAHDCVAMDVDVEIGGNDQTFNMLAGRHLMKKTKGKEKFVLATKLLTDNLGKKMGKTEGNIICLDDSPEDIYGKAMALPDELIMSGFELLTNKDLGALSENKRDAKAELAFELVKDLYSEGVARVAAERFDKIFRDKKMPDQMEEKAVGCRDVVGALVEAGLARSKSQARQLIEQKGVKVDGKAISLDARLSMGGQVVQVGRRKFVRLVAKR